jgi:heparan-alpha-glucosaminide N-acetyltransferase
MSAEQTLTVAHRPGLAGAPTSGGAPSPTGATARPQTGAPPDRLASLDAYRGFVMLLMISAGLNISRVAVNFRESAVWQFLAHQTDHASWRGCTLWDLIQPSFMFIVGVALPYSLAARQAQNSSFRTLFPRALWRSFALILLGIFLASTGGKQTNFSFVIVLTQIGLAYPFLWLLAWTKPRTQFIAAGLLLLGYWAAFSLYPLPSPGFTFQEVGLPMDWPFFSGFEAHWEKNVNVAQAFDRWFLNLFPQSPPFLYNAGGYLTLNFVPSLATMILGLIAGGVLRSNRSGAGKLWWMVIAGIGCLMAGALWDASGLCPMVKRIWTPSFAIFSAGWAFLLLALFYGFVELKGYRRWTFPFIVAGMNSIALYCMSMLMKPWIRDRLRLHLGQDVFTVFGSTFAPMLEMASILCVLWLVSFWMYRRRIFLRI